MERPIREFPRRLKTCANEEGGQFFFSPLRLRRRFATRLLDLINRKLNIRHTVVFEQLSGADARSHAPARASLGGTAMITPTSLSPLLQRFFTQRLMQQRQASPHTISSYRDTFRQFLKFTQQRLRKPVARQN